MSLRTALPLLARHEGDWRGTYVTVDVEGRVIDSHASHLTCTFPSDGPAPYLQTNRYLWADGRSEEFFFPGTLGARADGRPCLRFDTERIDGEAWEADDKTILLRWKRKDIASSELVEMIQLSNDGDARTRTWHWFEDDRLVKRTLIEERRVKGRA